MIVSHSAVFKAFMNQKIILMIIVHNVVACTWLMCLQHSTTQFYKMNSITAIGQSFFLKCKQIPSHSVKTLVIQKSKSKINSCKVG